MILPPLYHWSPADRHDHIRRDGLIPGSPECIATGPLPHICLSPDPARAWALSGATGWHPATAWDLWQVRLGGTDEVHVRPTFGGEIDEFNVRTVIPPQRLWWVARRHTEGDSDADR